MIDTTATAQGHQHLTGHGLTSDQADHVLREAKRLGVLPTEYAKLVSTAKLWYRV